MSSEDEVLKVLREQHAQLMAEREATGGPAFELTEKVRHDALKALDKGALATAMGLHKSLTEVIGTLPPLGAFYDAAGMSRMISESAFGASLAHDALDATAGISRVLSESALSASLTQNVLGSTDWMKTAVGPLFSERVASQLDALNLARPLVSEHLAALTGAFSTDYMKGFAGLLEGPLRNWQELFEGYEEDEQRLLATIVPLGWLISPSMAIGTIRQLANVEDIEALDEALVGCFTPDRCAEIIDNLYGDPDFAELRPILDEGIAAHREGLYRAAVLVWLAVIDGIARRKFNVSVFGESKRKASGRLRKMLESGSTSHDGLREALIEILKRVSVKAPDPHMLKRDLVIHGAEVEFGNERASIQMILVLEVMHFCAPVIEADEEAA